MSIWKIPDLLCAPWLNERSFLFPGSTHIKADNNCYLIQYSILLQTRKNYPTMKMTQATRYPSCKKTHLHLHFYILFHSLYWWNLKSYAILSTLCWNFIDWTKTLYAHIHIVPADLQKFTVNKEHEGWFSFPNTYTFQSSPPQHIWIIPPLNKIKVMFNKAKTEKAIYLQNATSKKLREQIQKQHPFTPLTVPPFYTGNYK